MSIQIKELKIKGGNFVASISGTVSEAKLQEVVEAGIAYEAERSGLSKVFKGVKDRKTVAFSADASKVFGDKLTEGLKALFGDDLSVSVSKREWSEGAGGAQAKAQAAYDEMIVLGMTPENALKVALKVHAGFKVAEVAKPAEAAPEAPQDAEVPMEG